MAAIPTTLATLNDTATNGTVHTIPSFTPGASKLLTVALAVSGTSPTPAPTLSGHGITWTQVTQSTAAARTVHIFRGVSSASPTAGTITVTTATALTQCQAHVVQWDGALTTGTGGADGVINVVNGRPASGTSVSLAYPSAVTAGNATYGVVGVIVSTVPTPGTGWTSAMAVSQTAPVTGFIAEWSTSAPQQNITASWSGASVPSTAGVEIVSAPTGGGNLDALRLGASVVGLRVGAVTPSAAYLGSVKVWP